MERRVLAIFKTDKVGWIQSRMEWKQELRMTRY
jgi:hypothetical protein